MAGKTENKPRREKGTGSIYQKGDKWIEKLDVGIGPDGKRKSKYFSGKTQAEVKRKIREFNKSGEPVDIAKVSVQTYIYDWLETYKKNTIKDTSYDTLEKTVRNYIVPYLGSYQLPQLTSDDIQKFLQNLKNSGYSYSTVKKAYNCLNEVLKHATIKKDIAENPMLVVNLLSEESFEKKEIRYFDEKECALIVEEAQRKYSTGRDVYVYGDAYILILNTGLRLGELIGLEKSDWDRENKTIHVRRNIQFIRNRGEDGKVVKGRQMVVNSTKTYSGDHIWT